VAQIKYALQLNVTFFNPITSFFGRTYRGRLLPLRILQDSTAKELITDEDDWVLFYTQAQAIETKAIVEVILVEID